MLGNPKYIFIAFFTFLVIQPCSAQIFKEVGEEVDIQHQQIFSALMGGGVAFFDFDNDGDQDIYLTGGESRDRLYLNKGGWEFEEIGAQVGLIITENMVTTGVTTGDIDNDGVREIFVTSFNSENLLFKKNDQGVLENVAPEANIIERMASTAASFGDFNLDGFLDLYVVNHLKMNGVILDNNNIPIGFDPICLPNHIYFNNGDGSFTEMAEVLGVNDDGCGLAVSITDFDHDHDVDLLIANDFGEWLNPNIAFSNNYPATTFDDVSTVTGFDAAIYAMGIAPGDYDLDGDLDYYITNLGRNILLQNNGLGQFLDVASEAKVENTYVSDLFATGWGTAFFDYDNDLYPDLFVSNGEIPTFEFVGNAEFNPNKLFHNLGNGKFEDVSEIEGVDEGTRARGFAYADLDQDGDLDMIVGVVARSILNDEKFLVYRNEQTNNYNWLNVNIEGTISNRDGYGSLITLYIDGKKLIREVDGGSSHGSQHSSVIHYGLGNHTRADSLIITWPGGKRTIIRGFDVSQELFVKEKNTKIIISNKIGENLSESSLCSPLSSSIKLVNYNAENKYQLFDVTHQQYIDEVSNFSGDTLELNTGDIVENTSYEIHIRNDNWPYFEVLDAEIKKFAVLPAPEITQDGFILTSSIGAQYTWYFNNEKIASQDREIIIEGMGTYQVGVTNTYGCIAYSEKYGVLVTGIDNQFTSDIIIYPNPVINSLMIDVKSNIDNNFEIQVTDLLERNFDMTNKCSSTDNHLELDVSQLLPGVYYLTVSTITEKVRYRVIKI